MRTVEHRLKSSAENSIEIPLSLNRIEERTLERYKTHLRIKRAKSFSLSFIGVLLFLFYSANSTLSFAQNMKSVPLLSELLEVFRFEDESKDAVQEIGMILSNEKSEVHLQYVLSDAKRLILYFQFPEGITLNDHDLIELKVLQAYDADTNENISEFFHPSSYQFAGSFENDNRYLWLNGALPPNSEETLPKNLGMRIHVEVQRRTFDQKMEITEVLDLGEFHFEIPLTKTRSVNKLPVKESFSLFDVPMELESIENSLLGQTLLWKQKNLSQYRIKQLLGKVEDADTGVLLSESLMTGYYNEKTGQFTTGYGNVDKAGAKRLKITVFGANLMPRASENITIDVENQTLVNEVKEVELVRVNRSENRTELLFKFTPKIKPNGVSFGVFWNEYIDESGDLHRFDRTSYSGNADLFFIEGLIADKKLSGQITIKQWGLQGYETYLEKPLVFYVDLPEKPSLPEMRKENP